MGGWGVILPSSFRQKNCLFVIIFLEVTGSLKIIMKLSSETSFYLDKQC